MSERIFQYFRAYRNWYFFWSMGPYSLYSDLPTSTGGLFQQPPGGFLFQRLLGTAGQNSEEYEYVRIYSGSKCMKAVFE